MQQAIPLPDAYPLMVEQHLSKKKLLVSGKNEGDATRYFNVRAAAASSMMVLAMTMYPRIHRKSHEVHQMRSMQARKEPSPYQT